MTPEQEADIARLSALRDSGQISAEDFARLSAAIRGAEEPAGGPPAAPIEPAPPALPLGREKPVHAADPETTTPWQQPVPESGRDPRAAFEPAPDGGAPDAATPVAPEPAAPVAAAVVPGESVPPVMLAAGTPGGAGGEPPPHAPPPPPDPFERYPLRYGVLYPDRLSRLSTFFRLFLLIPLVLFYYPFSIAFQGLTLIGWTAVFWRKKYPSWAFRGITGMLEFQARATAYTLLQADKFPSFDREESLVRLDFQQPAPGQLSRWRVFFWKLFLILPHIIVLYFLYLALAVVTVLAWFGIMFTGNYPRGMFGFATGVTRWQLRVTSYFLSLNDRFPPYSLSDDAREGGRGASIVSGIAGFAGVAAITALIIAVVIITGQTHNEDVNYAGLQLGNGVTTTRTTPSGDIIVQLQKVTDPGDALIQVIKPAPGEKVIVFQWRITNTSSSAASISSSAGHLTVLTTEDGPSKEKGYGAVLVAVADRSAPVSIRSDGTATVQAVFVVPSDARPTDLQFHNGSLGRGGITYHFH